MNSNDFSQTILYSNETSGELKLILEPWGELYILESGVSVKIVGTSKDISGFFEIEHISDGVVIYGWVGSIVKILHNNHPLEPNKQE